MKPVGTLSFQELGRATLARQFLLERTARSALATIEHLVAMQAQSPNAPYAGLWSRIEGFAFDDLAALMVERSVVRMLTLRSTVHLMTPAEAAGIRPLVQVVLDREYRSVRKKALDAAGVDPGAVAERARGLLAEQSLTAAQIAGITTQDWPGAPREHLSQIPRLFLPMVQVPPRGVWGKSGQASYAMFQDWTGLELEPFSLATVVRRYLAAYGPATVKDAQQWCGLTRLKAVFDELGDELVVFEGPSGERLYDLPEAPRPPGDAPAPVRILPEYDNLMLSHADRTRIVDDDRRLALLAGPQVIGPTLLVDGRVAATCKVDHDVGGGRLLIRPFAQLSREARGQTESEGVGLLEAMGGKFAGGRVEFDEVGTGYSLGWT